MGEVTARLYFDKNDPVERGSFDDTMRVERTLSRGRRLLFHSKVEIGLHKKQGQLIFLTGRKEQAEVGVQMRVSWWIPWREGR